MAQMQVTIVGAGIAGLASALALTKWMPNPPQITVIELRAVPSTMGGAIGLTPNALRALVALGVMEQIKEKAIGASIDRIELYDIYSASSLGTIDFSGPNGEGLGQPPLKGLRILRSDLLQSILSTVAKHGNITIEYGRTITGIKERSDKIELQFGDDSEMLSADFLVGADGIHSIVRKLHIEPMRIPEYTGIAAVCGFADVGTGTFARGWKDTALGQALRGSLLCSYYEPSRTKHFVAAVMETADVKSKEGWVAMGKEQDEIKHRVEERYLGGNVKMKGISDIVNNSHSWNLYPVYSLTPQGTWSSPRAILVGDAAHAMPPQGESAGIALEDAIILGRTLSKIHDSDLASCLAAYERLRRPRVDEAYRQASFGWDTLKDSGWFAFYLKSWLTWIFLWWTAQSRAINYSEDLSTADLNVLGG